MKELTLIERASVALNSSETEKHLAKLAGEYKGITSVTNAAGRAECHAAMMACKSARIEIEKSGKAAREDATKFSKAVIEEEKRLVAIISPEEERLAGIRDEWDAAREAERKAAEELERQRVQAIRDKIDTIRQLPLLCSQYSITALPNVVTELKALQINLENFAEFTGEALQAQGKALAALQMMITEKQAEAEEKAWQEALRKAEEERMAAERAELARLRKEQEERDRIAHEEWLKKEAQARADRDAIYAEQQRVNAELDRQREEMRQQQEAIDAEKARIAKIEHDRIDAEEKIVGDEAAKKAAKKQPVEASRPSDAEIFSTLIDAIVNKYKCQPSDAEIWIQQAINSGQKAA